MYVIHTPTVVSWEWFVGKKWGMYFVLCDFVKDKLLLCLYNKTTVTKYIPKMSYNHFASISFTWE